MESWIQDLCSKQVDLSWPDADYPSPSKSRPAESLMPNPKNEALRVKMQELEDWTARFDFLCTDGMVLMMLIRRLYRTELLLKMK